VPIRNDQGHIECWAGINLDISDLKEAEIGLREAGRQKDEFLATLAHELRNPLAPIRNSLRMLGMKRCDVAAADAAHAMIERQVDHIVRLVDDLMEVSRITRGKIDLRKEHVPLQSIVANAVELASPIIEAAGHRLDIDVPDEPIVVHADPLRIAQTIGNLLNNAAKYTDRNGRIRLAVQRSRDELVISVSDTGIGISAETLPQVFDMFLQAGSTLRRAQGGLGIGLTLVRRLVELHGGAVEARSEGVGRGSEFIMRLPMSEHETPLGQMAAPALQQVALTPRLLLVVDDNHDAADSLAILLKSAGNEVRVVYDARAALETLRSFHPAVVFLDIGMPDMDGYELARRIRQRPELRDTSIVALTGWGQEDDRRRAAAAGCDDHLVKPVLWEAIQSLLANLDRAG
jgi:CheY-like chemotaxis protein